MGLASCRGEDGLRAGGGRESAVRIVWVGGMIDATYLEFATGVHGVVWTYPFDFWNSQFCFSNLRCELILLTSPSAASLFRGYRFPNLVGGSDSWERGVAEPK